LKKWNIENKIIYLTPDLLKNLKYFPLPFITFIRKKTGEELVLIEKLLEQTFFYYNPIENKKHKISIQDFKKNHAGVALVITDTTNAGQEDYFVILFKNYLISLIKLSGVIFLFFIVGLRIHELRLDIYYIAIFLLKLLGGGVCALLILREYKLDKEFVNCVCKDGKSDCGNVLDSAQSSFLGIVKWSDLGFIYFFGGALSIFIAGRDTDSILFYLGILNILSLIFSVYSISYQYLVKRWCIWCLSILTIFLMEAAILYNLQTQFQLINWWIPLLSYGIALSIPFWIRPFLEKIYQHDFLKNELSEYKYNYELFQNVLQTSKKYSDISQIAFHYKGNIDAKNEIILITNPFCPACKDMHEKMDKLFSDDSNKVSIKIILKVADEENAPSNIVARSLATIYEFEGEGEFSRATNEIFLSPEKKFHKFANKLDEFSSGNKISNLFIQQQSWLKKQTINYTPTIVFNGHQLPDMYKIEDIAFFVG